MKTLNRKHRKFKLSLQIAAILSCVAIASVGFASWIIVGNSTTSSSGSITAYTVSQSDFELVVDGDTTGNIILGKAKAADITAAGITSPWLVADNMSEEVLEKTFKIKYTAAKEITSATISVSLSALFGENESTGLTKIQSLLTNEYIEILVELWDEDPDTSGTSVDKSTSYNKSNTTLTTGPELTFDFSSNNEKVEGYVWVVVKFNWGNAFQTTGGNVNPYIYFNEKEANSDNKTAANNALTAIYEATGTGADSANTLTYKAIIVGKASATPVA